MSVSTKSDPIADISTDLSKASLTEQSGATSRSQTEDDTTSKIRSLEEAHAKELAEIKSMYELQLSSIRAEIDELAAVALETSAATMVLRSDTTAAVRLLKADLKEMKTADANKKSQDSMIAVEEKLHKLSGPASTEHDQRLAALWKELANTSCQLKLTQDFFVPLLKEAERQHVARSQKSANVRERVVEICKTSTKASLPATCAELNAFGSGLIEQGYLLHAWARGFSDEDVPALVQELASGHRELAFVIVSVHANNTNRGAQFIRVAAAHGFTDCFPMFFTCDDRGIPDRAPAWTPPSPHRLAKDDKANAWLWLIKGDGDLDDRVWAAIKHMGLINETDDSNNPAVFALLTGLYMTDRKVTAQALFDYRDIKKKTYLHGTAAFRGQYRATRCLVKSGADPKAQDYFRKTPRFYAESDDDKTLRSLAGKVDIDSEMLLGITSVAEFLIGVD